MTRVLIRPTRTTTMRIFFCLVMAGILFAAAPALAETKLRFYSWQTDDQSNSVWWKATIAAFLADHPGVAIDFVGVPRGEFADTMMTMFGANNPPDIVHLASFEFQAFADQGWLEDLTPLIARDGPDLKGWAGQGVCTIDGKTVCINLNYFGYILYYNDALLKAAGVGVPTNWDEYLSAARKMTAAGHGQSFGIGLQTTSGAGQYLTELLCTVLDAGGYWTDDAGHPTIDSPAVIEGLRHWKQLQREKLTPMGNSADDIRQLFLEGRIGMRLDGPWMWGLLDHAKPELRAQFKVAVPPFKVPLGGTSNVIAMPAGLPPERQRLVWDYIKMVTSQHWQEQYVALSGQLAPRPNTLTPDVLAKKSFLAVFQQSQDAAAAAGVDRLPKGFETTYNAFAKIVTEECQRMVNADLDPAETARRIQQRVLDLQRS
jgi:multiple sugar transport system substrate-binding protein